MKRQWENPKVKTLNLEDTFEINPSSPPTIKSDSLCYQLGWPGPKAHNVNEYWECHSVGQANGNAEYSRCKYLSGHDVCLMANSIATS